MILESTVGRGDARIRGHRASRAKVYGILEHGACSRTHCILLHRRYLPIVASVNTGVSV